MWALAQNIVIFNWNLNKFNMSLEFDVMLC